MIGPLMALWPAASSNTIWQAHQAANNQNVNTVVDHVNLHLYATGCFMALMSGLQTLCLCVDNIHGICPNACG